MEWLRIWNYFEASGAGLLPVMHYSLMNPSFFKPLRGHFGKGPIIDTRGWISHTSLYLTPRPLWAIKCWLDQSGWEILQEKFLKGEPTKWETIENRKRQSSQPPTLASLVWGSAWHHLHPFVLFSKSQFVYSSQSKLSIIHHLQWEH